MSTKEKHLSREGRYRASALWKGTVINESTRKSPEGEVCGYLKAARGEGPAEPQQLICNAQWKAGERQSACPVGPLARCMLAEKPAQGLSW